MLRPNVSHCVSENEVHYNPIPHDYSKDYFTIESLADNNTIYLKATNTAVTKTISASTDNGETWTEYTSTNTGNGVTVATLDLGNTVLIKAQNQTYGNSSYKNVFVTTSSFMLKGNIMSLVSGDSFINANELTSSHVFCQMFSGCTGLTSAENLVLPATALTDNCYQYMFHSCVNMTSGPSILPATTLTSNCYDTMFYHCTSLITAPKLPATTLATGCYSSMFNGCTSLTTAPELPATTLAQSCYYAMFDSCTSLTVAPKLPATTLVSQCYRGMFYGCTSLNSITCLAIDIYATNCLYNWVRNVAESGTFSKNVDMEDWTTGINGIPTKWTVQDAS